MKKLLLSVAVVTSVASALAFDEPGNLLKDFEFNDAEASWGVKSPKRGQIESFEGLAEPLFYLEGTGRGKLRQSFGVETQTWYVLSFRYRLTNDGKGNALDGTPFDCMANIVPDGSSEEFPARTLGTMQLGGTEKWGRARLYFQTGGDAVVRVNISFFSGNWRIGRIYVRKATDHDRLSGGALDDGGFESTRPGDLPYEWRLSGKRDATRLTTVERNAHGGGRALCADFGRSLTLVTPMCAFAKSEDSLRASIWVRASRRMLVEFKMTNPQGGVRRFNCRDRQWVPPDVWTCLEVTGKPVCLPERRGYTGVQFHLSATCDAEGLSELLVDDFNFSLASPESLLGAGDPTAPRLVNGSFEQGPACGNAGFFFDSTNVHDGVVRDFSVDDTTAAVGRCSLRVRGDGFRFASMPFRCYPDKPYTFSFWAKSTKPMKIRAEFPYAAIGEWEIGPEWKRYAGTCAPKREYVSPGYCNLRFGTEGVARDNVFWLDGLQLDYGDAIRPFRPAAVEIGVAFDALYKVFPVGSRQKLDIRLANGGEKPLDGEVVIVERDVRGTVMRKTILPAEVRSGDTLRLGRGYAVREPGYRHVEVSFVSGGRVLCADVTTCAGVLAPKQVPFAESRAGILGGFDNSGRNGQTWSRVSVPGGTWDEALDVMSLLGYRWLRTMACGNWRNTEYPEGTYNWKWDGYLAAAKAHGMGVMVEFLCHDAPPWSHGRELKTKVTGGFTYSMRPADVTRFATDFARHYAGKFDAVNLLNETCGHPPEDYVELMQAAYVGFKKTDPRLIVQGPGFPSSRFPQLVEPPGQETWIKRALDLGLNRWNDVHGIHPYDAGHAHDLLLIARQPFERSICDQPGADGRTSYGYLREQARRFKKTYPNNRIWDTESGAQFNTVAPGQFTPRESRVDWYTERLAAARAIRCNILRWSVGVERQFYFMFKFHLIFHGLDMFNVDMTPRAGVAALANFNRVLDGGRFERLDERDDGTFIAYFTGWKGERILVYWTPDHDTDGAPDAVFRMPTGLSPVSVCDMEGRALETLPLSCEPVYVICRGKEP